MAEAAAAAGWAGAAALRRSALRTVQPALRHPARRARELACRDRGRRQREARVQRRRVEPVAARQQEADHHREAPHARVVSSLAGGTPCRS